MNKPLVSIISICYNHEEYLEKAVDSFINQTYGNVQLIMADDASTDGSAALLKKLSEKEGFVFINNIKNIGVNNTISLCLAQAKGEYVCLISADDYMHPDKTRKQVEYLLNTGKDGVYANAFAFTENEVRVVKCNPVFIKNDKKAVLNRLYQYDWGGPLIQSALFKSEVLETLAPLRADFKSDDWAFAIKCYQDYHIGYIDEPLFYYRLHENNTHKKYWYTFPMRIDIISRLVPENFQLKALSNIMQSQGSYLIGDKHFGKGLRFYFASVFLNFSFKNLLIMAKTIAVSIKNRF